MGGNLVLEALRRILAALRSLTLQPVLVGGLGLQAWGRVRQTKDVDLLLVLDSSRREAVFRAAESFGLTRDPIHPIRAVGKTAILRMAYADAKYGITVRVDLIEAGDPFLAGVVRRSLAARVFGEDLRLARCEI